MSFQDSSPRDTLFPSTIYDICISKIRFAFRDYLHFVTVTFDIVTHGNEVHNRTIKIKKERGYYLSEFLFNLPSFPFVLPLDFASTVSLVLSPACLSPFRLSSVVP